MDFEEMKVIWDSQKDRPLFVMDQEALHASVRRRGLCIDKCVNIFDLFMIAILQVVAVILAVKSFFRSESSEPYQSLAVGAMLLVAACSGLYIALGRIQRRRREQRFDATLLGDLEKALSQVDYQMSRLKSFHWWFILPMALMTALNFVAKGVGFLELFDSTRIWIWPLFLASIVICYAAIRVEMSWMHVPRKRSLESLREKLRTEM